MNRDGQLRCPIYVGKAVPPGARKGGLGLDVDHGQALYKPKIPAGVTRISNLRRVFTYNRKILLDTSN